MHELIYRSGTGAEEVDLECEQVLAQTAEDIRGHEWEYTLNTSSISGMCRNAREQTLEVVFFDKAEADRLRRLADRDLYNKTPATLIAQKEWVQQAYIVKAEWSTIEPNVLVASLTVVLLEGVWRKKHTIEVGKRGKVEWGALDFDFNCPFDLGATQGLVQLSINTYTPAPIGFIVSGKLQDFECTINNNLYQVNTELSRAQTLTVDPINRTVTVYDADKDSETNVFSAATRGLGLNQGKYIFQPLPAGEHLIECDETLEFTIVWYEEESEPVWSWL